MRFFVAGTDTGVGKTLVSGLFVRFLREMGQRVTYQKWVTTGDRDFSGDAEWVKDFAAIDVDPGRGSLHAPLCYSFPASPHLAAEMDGEEPDLVLVMDAFATLSAQPGWLVVEGAGGLMVPLSRRLLLIDFVKDSGLPVVLVCRSGLGTINHTLLSVEALRSRAIPVAGLVFNTLSPGPEEIARDNVEVIAELSKVPVLGRLPLISDIEAQWDAGLKEEVAGMVEGVKRRLEEVARHG